MIKLNVPYFDSNERQAVEDCLSSGMVSSGEKVEEFEEKVRRYCGAKYAVAVSSCTAGLYLVLNNKLRGYVDTLAIPAFTFPAANRICDHVNGNIWIADVDVNKNTYNMDINALGNSIAVERLNGIAPIHQFGLPCDMDAIRRIVHENDIFVLEDAACALGSEYKGEKIGRRGTAVFSFHGRKIITTGEGGMVVTDDEDIYKAVLQGRQFGRNRYGDFVSSGLNFKMADINAAIGLAQMEKIDKILENRRKVAQKYSIVLYGHGLTNIVKLPQITNCDGHNWQSYVVRLQGNNRDAVMMKMRAAGIEVQVGSYDNSNGKCKVSSELARTTLALPIWSAPMPEETIEKVVEELGRCLTI